MGQRVPIPKQLHCLFAAMDSMANSGASVEYFYNGDSANFSTLDTPGEAIHKCKCSYCGRKHRHEDVRCDGCGANLD